jgi:di/tricarboxylate transporter
MDLTPIGAFIEAHQATISLILIAAMFVAFVREILPASAVATITAAAFLVFGFIDTDDAVGVFANSAVVTIGAMLVISAALVRTGVLEALASRVLALAQNRPRLALSAILVGTLVLSAFVNTTPVVVIMLPLMTSLAAAIGIANRKVLIPLSYVAILGGTCTLLGTSTNLLVDGLAREAGQPGFGIFEITPIGMVAALTGLAWLAFAGNRLLPGGEGDRQSGPSRPTILSEVAIGPDFPNLGKDYAKHNAFMPRGVNIVGVYRKGAKLAHDEEGVQCEAGDVVVFRATQEELATMATLKGATLGLSVRDPGTEGLETLRITIGPNSRDIDNTLLQARFMSRIPMRALGMSRSRHLAGPDLDSARLRAGDRIWVEARRGDLDALASDPGIILSEVSLAKPFRREKAALAIATLATVVGLSALGVLPIAALGIIGVAFLLATRGIDAADAWEALSGELFVLIFAMLMVGKGLENTGAAELVVSSVMPLLQGQSPIVVIIALYALASTLTEAVSNNAVAVILTPIAISMSEQLGMDARTLLVAVMFGASASFATPIGYQTNTIVYTAGNYRFSDFVRIGVPMNLIVGIATCIAIAIVFG